MNTRMHCAVISLVLSVVPRAVPSEDLFSGTWCVGRQGLVISFIGGDTVHVTSLNDASIDGWGTYTRDGSRLTATMTNEDLELKMGYKYRVKEDATIRAKILFFTVDGDSVNHPHRWLRMQRCDPEKGIPPGEDDEEEDGEEDEEEE
ncbi:MAG: hypothetical protein GF418_05645 [Chitinivibrionales bacterium]|nr:hypothetical protein [Chitinivibrionales bacterium]MBD3395094.1 hypothetical protein [Chitinivibrionales bacterium]